MESYHASATPSVAPRAKLLPFQYIASPPPAEVFKVILEHCGVGGTFAPGVRQLSLWSGVSRGLIDERAHEADDRIRDRRDRPARRVRRGRE